MDQGARIFEGDARVERAIAGAHRREWALVLAATARLARDLDLAEECVQEAYAAALDAWARDGVPKKPGAWLTTTARRRALDALRRRATTRPTGPRSSRSTTRCSRSGPRR